MPARGGEERRGEAGGGDRKAGTIVLALRSIFDEAVPIPQSSEEAPLIVVSRVRSDQDIHVALNGFVDE